MPDLKTRIVKALADGPWSAWEVATILSCADLGSVTCAMRSLARSGLIKRNGKVKDPLSKRLTPRWNLNRSKR